MNVSLRDISQTCSKQEIKTFPENNIPFPDYVAAASVISLTFHFMRQQTILLVEDEQLIALDLQCELEAGGIVY